MFLVVNFTKGFPDELLGARECWDQTKH